MNQVANPRKPLRLNVGFIINSSIGTNRDFDIYFPKYQDDDLVIAEAGGVVNVGRTPQGLIVQGNFSGKVTLECVRCLTDYEHLIRWEFAELYAFTQDNVTDSGLLVPDDAQIDLQLLFREYALLEFPIKPLCREDCEGLCAECGQNLNQGDCGHSPEVDTPFLALKGLLENQHNDELD